jgi:hypothetical protein
MKTPRFLETRENEGAAANQEKAGFHPSKPSVPPLVRGGAEKQTLARHNDGIHAITCPLRSRG